MGKSKVDERTLRHILEQANDLLERLYKKCHQTGVLDKAEITKMFDHRLRMREIGGGS